MKKRVKIVLISNIPAPYRIPVFNKVAEYFGDKFLVIYCAKIEPDRKWDLPFFKHNHIFLKENFKVKKGRRYIHNNIEIFKILLQIKPNIVITTGFNPTHLYAFLYTLISRRKHIPMTDGTFFSESFLSWRHKLIRKIVYLQSKAFIGASKGSFELYKSYGIEKTKIFRSHLCIDNNEYKKYYKPPLTRKYDIMFSGVFEEKKMPFFFIEVAKILKNNYNKLKILLIGDGPLRDNILYLLQKYKIKFDYPGFIMQKDLPVFYSDAKLFLFPTQNDTWGIVANESCAAGTPVITCSNAGVAGDLVIDGYNGYILKLDPRNWADKILKILHNKFLLNKLSKNALVKVKDYNFDKAAKGIISAIQYVNK